MIVGIIVLFIIAGSIAVYNNMSSKEALPVVEKTTAIENKGKTVSKYIEECLDSTGKEGLLTIGLQGGYYNLPENYFSTEYTDVPYYYYNDITANIRTKEDIASNLGKYIDDNIGFCLNNFEEFTNMGYIIEADEPKTTITIGNNKLFAKLNMPISVDSNGINANYKTFSGTYEVRLEAIFQTSNQILTNTIIDPYRIYYSLILNLMEEYDLQIDTMTYSDDTIIYVIQDSQSIINDVPFVFLFAIKINTTNVPPELDLPAQLTAEVGKEFNYTVSAYDREEDWLEYDIQSDILGIHPFSGEIKFTPTAADIGVHEITILVTDGIDITSKKINFVVVQ